MCIMGSCRFIQSVWGKMKFCCLTSRRSQDQPLLRLDEVNSREQSRCESYEELADNATSEPQSLRNIPNEENMKSETNFTNRSWACQPCLPEIWLPCDGPLEPELFKEWNVGGMFDYQNANEMGWNGGQWPPR